MEYFHLAQICRIFSLIVISAPVWTRNGNIESFNFPLPLKHCYYFESGLFLLVGCGEGGGGGVQEERDGQLLALRGRLQERVHIARHSER